MMAKIASDWNLWWKNQLFVMKFRSEKLELEKLDLTKILVSERIRQQQTPGSGC